MSINPSPGQTMGLNVTTSDRTHQIYLFLKSLHHVNTNRYVCKSITYLLAVSVMLNAMITVFFSLERAFAINFPLKMRNLRENHRTLFHSIIFIIILYSFAYPTYSVWLADLVARPHTQNTTLSFQCDIPVINCKKSTNSVLNLILKKL